MTTVFLDTGYVLALEVADDQHHAVAKRHWERTKSALPEIATTSYVFDEIVTFFNARGYYNKAVEVGDRLIDSPSVHLVHVDEAIFGDGWRYLKQHSDKSYSLTDCISFVIMNARGIRTALAFDRHFVQAGFENSL